VQPSAFCTFPVHANQEVQDRFGGFSTLQNPTTVFLLANGKPASFIFATDHGTIQAWNTGTTAQVMVNNSSSGAVYKVLAINPSASAPLVYAANFRSGKIDTREKPGLTDAGVRPPSSRVVCAPSSSPPNRRV
jgi:hypothetical protein